jgi:hypothetical protein
VGITRKDAEAHLAHLARRRARYAARKAAPTPREPEQLPLFAKPEPSKPTPEEREAIEREAKNIGRAWITRIKEGFRD